MYRHFNGISCDNYWALDISFLCLLSVPLGERHFFPPCARHAGHCGLRRTLQLLGQRRPHEVKDLGAAGPANHGVLLQPQRQHLCIRLQLRLVKGGTFRACLLFAVALAALLCSFFLSQSDSLQGHEYYNPQKKNYIFLRNAAEELKPRNKKWWEKGTVCRRGSCTLSMGMLYFFSVPLTLSRAFNGTHWPQHMDVTLSIDISISSLLYDGLSVFSWPLSEN